MREVDMVRVKGRVQAVRTYELVAGAGAVLPPAQDEALQLYAAGLAAYRKQLWEDAFGLFTQALAVSPEDGPSRVMATRCQTYQDTPPPDDWDGVFEQLVKA
jgi:adenylate cyclase